MSVTDRGLSVREESSDKGEQNGYELCEDIKCESYIVNANEDIKRHFDSNKERPHPNGKLNQTAKVGNAQNRDGNQPINIWFKIKDKEKRCKEKHER